MKKVIVTGAGGFIGGSLVEKLLELGVEVYGVDISEAALSRHCGSMLFHPVIADFSVYDHLATIVGEEEYDAFFHFAWAGKLGGADLGNVDLQIDNARFAAKAAAASVELNVKQFVFCSSSYQNTLDKSTDEPVNIYGLCKKTAQELCRAKCCNTNTKYNTAIMTNTFGIGDRSNKAVNYFIRSMLSNKSLQLVIGNDLNDWVYIDDTVDGLLNIISKGKPGLDYYIGHRKITSFKEKILLMKETLNSSSELYFGEYPETTYINYNGFDLDALYNDTGFECKTDFRQSIIKTAEWVKALNWEE